MDCKDLCC